MQGCLQQAESYSCNGHASTNLEVTQLMVLVLVILGWVC